MPARQNQQPARLGNEHVRAGRQGDSAVMEYMSGPLPSPDALAKYEAILPGAADRIITMAESQSGHRQTLEAQAVPAAIEAEKRGQHYGLAVAITSLIVSAILGLNDQEVVAGIIGGGTVVSLAGVFVYGRTQQARERERERADG